MAVTEIKIKAEVILLVMSDAPVSKEEKDTLTIEIEQILNNMAPIIIPKSGEVGEIKIGTRFHFLEIV